MTARIAELEAQVAALTAELAEARKPRWVWHPAHHSDCLVVDGCADVLAYCWARRVDGAYIWQIDGEDVSGDAATLDEAKAAAEAACGVEGKNGDL